MNMNPKLRLQTGVGTEFLKALEAMKALNEETLN
jgi:hypothetical protein